MRMDTDALTAVSTILFSVLTYSAPAFADVRFPQYESGSSHAVLRRSTRQASSCFHNGQLYRCGLSITCLFTGGILTTACGNLLSCCRPEPPQQRLSGRRRGRGFRFTHAPHSLSLTRNQPYRIVFRRRPQSSRLFSNVRPPKQSPPAQLLIHPASGISARFQRVDESRRQAISNEITESTFSNHPQCGTPYPFLQKRIIGGREASYGELPWQAHIRILGYQCGGVIVNPSYVVTAAHCVHKADMNDIKIHLGEYDTKNTGFYPEPYPSEVRSVVEVKIHPRFHYMLTQPDRFDVAVLRVNFPVEYRPNILPICLPAENADFTGQTAVVAGWGKTDNSFSKTGTNVLNKALVPIITNQECLDWHFQKHIDLQLHGEMFCAGHEIGQRDACLGDSGGPLIVLDDDRWTLAGITSAGFGCAIDRQPGIYHKVSTSTRWIQENVLD